MSNESLENPFGLTKGEMDAVGLVVQGFTNQEISVKLGIPVDAVTRRIVKIYDKMDVCTRLELAMKVLQHAALKKD